MIRFTLLLLICLSSFVLISCGGGQAPASQNSAPEEQPVTEPAAVEEPIETPATEEVSIDAEISIDAVGNTMADMAYSASELSAPAFSNVKLTLRNVATEAGMIHNLVIVPTDAADEIASAGLKAGPDKQYVPEDSRVIAYTAMANPGEEVSVIFETPGPGEYLFVCTYPGHAQMMRGAFKVQ